jgi:hypothetical protein
LININKVTGSKLLTWKRMRLVFGDEVGTDQGAGGEECGLPLHFADCGRGEAFE